MKTMQEAFDTVVTHLLTQNAKSVGVRSTSSCKYRGEQGMKCAVGCLIADEHYHPDLEDMSSSNSGVETAIRKSGYVVDEKLYRRLQRVHDNIDVKFWPGHLEMAARDANLKFNPPEGV